LPAVLGTNALPSYTGYKPGVNPGIANEFSTALFRLGHSMLGDDVEFLDNRGLPVADEIPLSEAFSNPPVLQATGIDPILKYLASDPSSEVDNTIVNSVRNFLFGAPGAGGFDLASLNIQRGRDHGLASYNDAREGYGLSRVSSFSDISSDPTIQAKLQELYGNVDNIDLWVGALAEDHVAGSSTGELIRAALIDQFTRLRDGDSFWFERTFSGTALSNLEKTSLSDLIRRNTGADVVQDNVFFFRASISGTVFNDSDRDGRQDRGEGGLAGRTIQLYNVSEGDPELVAETTTNRNCNYRFDIFDGLRTGNYQVVEVVPSGWKATTANPRTVNIPRGQTFLDVDFGNVRTFTAASPSSALGTAGSTDTGASPSAGFAATPGQAFLPADGTAAEAPNATATQPTTSTSQEVNQLPVDDSTTSTGTVPAAIAESEPAPLLIQPISGMDEFSLLGPIGV
ncbi:MAG TPA: peroxidase family protein, partial [Gemmata sp.]|nr:peroxidase family protein [Gemmata sp.]